MGVKTAKITDNHAGPTESSSQGEPFSFIRTMTVGFGIAPNLLTSKATPSSARGLRGWRVFSRRIITAGGDFHPALRTDCGEPQSADSLRRSWPARKPESRALVVS